MNKKKTFKIIVPLVLVAAIVIASLFAFTKKSGIVQAESLDLERAVKLKIYASADNILGAYVEDRNISGTTRWTYKVISEVLRDNGLSLTDDEGTNVMSALTSSFSDMYDTKSIYTDGLGGVSELSKSYIANAGAAGLFSVRPDLKGTQVVDEKYISYNYMFANSRDIMELRELIDKLDKETTSLSEDGVSANSDIFLQVKELKDQLEATETLVAAIDNSVVAQMNSVTERVDTVLGKVTEDDGKGSSEGTSGNGSFSTGGGMISSSQAAEYEASIVAQYNSITVLQQQLESLSNTVNTNTQTQGSNISSLQNDIETAKSLIENTKTTLTEQMATNNQVSQTLSEQAQQLIAQNLKTEALETSLTNTINNNQTTLNNTIATTKTELSTLVSTTRSELTTNLNTLQTNSQNALTEASNTLNATIQSTKHTIEASLNAFIATTNANFDAVSDRIDELERLLYINTASINSAMNGVIANIDSVNTTEFRNTVTSNCTALTAELIDLRADLTAIAATLDTTKPKDANLNTQINSLIGQITVASDMIEEYRTNILGRIDNIDNKVAEAKTAFTNSEAGAEALLIEAANLLLSAQNAEAVYRAEVNSAVGQIMTNVASIKGYDNLKNAADTLTDAVNNLAQEMETNLAALEANYTAALNNLKAETETNLDALETKLDMTRIGGFSIAESDWHIDSSLFGGAGGYYVAITHESINENSYIEVQYAGNPDLQPTYTGYGNTNETHTIWICTKTNIPVTISNIFVYNQQIETATTDATP